MVKIWKMKSYFRVCVSFLIVTKNSDIVIDRCQHCLLLDTLNLMYELDFSILVVHNSVLLSLAFRREL
jgi:hypothetical protein